MRGYFGIAILNPKHTENVGGLWRTASILGADCLATIGNRYKRQPTDTYNSTNHIPLFEYGDFNEFYRYLPKGCMLVGVELTPESELLDVFTHPQRAYYLLGSEDNGLPTKVLEKCHKVIKLRGDRSMNVATAGSIVMYHRTILR